MNENIIELRGITKYFGDSKAVNNINLEIRNGEFLTLLGPSGCGKTTLLRILSGIESADEGQIFIHGKDVTHMPPEQRHLNMVFQSYALFPHMTTFENVAFGLRCKHLPEAEIKTRVEKALSMVKLEAYAERKPQKLSGGQQQRVAIARSLVNNPVVILADEATGNLDTRTSYEIMDLFQRLNDQGKTIVFVTHEPDIARLTKRSIIFRDGHVIKEQMVTDRLIARDMLNALPVEQD